MKHSRKVVVLTNYLPPYWISILDRLEKKLDALRIYLSTSMESNRVWEPNWGALNVSVQKTFTLSTTWRHPYGFTETIQRHFPYDTLALLRRDRPDVIISAQLGIRTLQAVIYRKLFKRSRLVIWTAISSHTEKNLSWFRTCIRRGLLRNADAVTANGRSAASYLVELGVPRDQICTVPYAIDLSAFFSLPIEREPSCAQRLIFFGQLVERKGLLPFLKMLGRWCSLHPKRAVELWFVGDGPLRRPLEEFTVPPSLKVKFIGSKPYCELHPLYGQAGILVFPTLADEWGVVVNEALASGMPVLGSLYSQAVEELVEEGINGWTYRPDYEKEIFDAINRALTTDAVKLDEMRSTARHMVRYLDPEFGAVCFSHAIDVACASTGRARSTGADEPPKSCGPDGIGASV